MTGENPQHPPHHEPNVPDPVERSHEETLVVHLLRGEDHVQSFGQILEALPEQHPVELFTALDALVAKDCVEVIPPADPAEAEEGFALLFGLVKSPALNALKQALGIDVHQKIIETEAARELLARVSQAFGAGE